MSDIFADEPSLLVVTCSSGIAPILAQEISELGFKVGKVFDTAVETHGTLQDCMRLNLNLRTAHRVLYTLDRFKARNGDDLYDEAVEIPWERYLDCDGYFSVDRSVSNPTIRNTAYAALKLKDAIADRMRSKCGRRPDSGNERTDACVFLHWLGDQASIYIDTTGEALSFRGYREISSQAPLRESLAAALVLASGWDRHAPLLNPMCGCGTIAIEALWIAQNRPPALFRDNFAFKHLSCYKPALWTELKGAALKEFSSIRNTPCQIIASDIDEHMAKATLHNASVAAADSAIKVDTCDILLSPHPATSEPGVAIMNPPYGGRIGDAALLGSLYEDIGGFAEIAAKDNYSCYVITGNPDLCEEAGLHAARRRIFYSGDLECVFMERPELDAVARRRFMRRNPGMIG